MTKITQVLRFAYNLGTLILNLILYLAHFVIFLPHFVIFEMPLFVIILPQSVKACPLCNYFALFCNQEPIVIFVRKIALEIYQKEDSSLS